MIEDLLKLRGCLLFLPGIQICARHENRWNNRSERPHDPQHEIKNSVGMAGASSLRMASGLFIGALLCSAAAARIMGNILIAHAFVFPESDWRVSLARRKGLGRVAVTRQGHGCDGFSFASR